MRVDDLDLPEEAREALREQGYIELHPPQADSIPAALEGRNLVVSAPTASGKSLIAYAAALKKVLSEGRKVLYIVPLKALASEKKDDFDRFAGLGIRTAMSVGDLDSEDRRLGGADVIVATSEKADSLMRHGSPLIAEVGLTIADEVHLIHDPSRGPTLEVTLTKLMRKNPGMQVIALSATITNASDLAHWLGAELVVSSWRPVPLRQGVCFGGEVLYEDGGTEDASGGSDEVWSLISATVDAGGQCIVFVNSRRSTEALAARYSAKMRAKAGRTLSDEEVSLLEGDADSTSLGRRLAACVACGISFHNAGLTSVQRRYVEGAFRSGGIRCIVATPTLAAGINLPARRVVVRDTRRYEANAGYAPIPAMEVKQMCGRAGRPGFDDRGEAILMAKSEADRDHLMDDYIRCDSERVMSKLGDERTLRTHILSLFATGDACDEDGVVDFMRSTFYGSESQLYGIESVVDSVVAFLEGNGMVERAGGRVEALPFGKRVSDLYIDPESAVLLKGAVERMDAEGQPDFPVLHAVASTPDVLSLYPRVKDREALQALDDQWGGRLLVDVDCGERGMEYYYADLKTAELLSEWIGEVPEDAITDGLGVGPGDIRSKVDMAGWMLYAMSEIAALFRPEAVRGLRALQSRVKYGVKAELSDLVSLKGVGRARARALFSGGYRTRADLARADPAALSSMPGIGPALAAGILRQVGAYAPDSVFKFEEEEERKREPAAPAGPRQSRLLDFRLR